MNNWITDGDELRFEPGPGWSWHGWNGRLKVSAPDRGLKAGGQPVALASDIIRLASQLAGRMYTAAGFADVPGSAAQATVSVQTQSLAPQTSIGGQNIVVDKSEGKFILTCTPSSLAGPPPVPDPVLVKQGRWFVDRSQQSAAKSGE